MDGAGFDDSDLPVHSVRMAGAKTKNESMPTLLGLADALLETVRAWEIAAAVPSEDRLGASHHDAFTHAPKRQPPASGPALIAAHRPPVWVTRRSSPEFVRPPSVARVPRLPNPEELRALLHDRRHAYAETSEPERRVSRAHLQLIQWLRESYVQAWASRTVETARGEVVEGPVAPIPADYWDKLNVVYSARFLDEDSLIPCCDAELPQWTGKVGGRQVSGRLVWHGVMVDLDQFQGALGSLQLMQTEVALLRPTAARAGWAVRVNSEERPINVSTTTEGLQRGLKALWVLIRGPEVKLPYILLEEARRRAVATRPKAVRADDNEALDRLRSRLAAIFEEFWQDKISDVEANSQTCSALSEQIRETKRGATSLGFPELLAALALQRTTPPTASNRKTPEFAQVAKRTVREDLRKATAAMRKAVNGRLPGLPDEKGKGLGHLLDDYLDHRSMLWVVYAPPPLVIWRAE